MASPVFSRGQRAVAAALQPRRLDATVAAAGAAPPGPGTPPAGSFQWTAGDSESRRLCWSASVRAPLVDGGILAPLGAAGGLAAVLAQSFNEYKAYIEVESSKPHKTCAGSAGVRFARRLVHRVACAAVCLARSSHSGSAGLAGSAAASELAFNATAHLILDHAGIFDLLQLVGTAQSEPGADSAGSRCCPALSLPLPSYALEHSVRTNLSSEINNARRRLFIGTEVMICIILERQLVGHEPNWGSVADASLALGGVRDPMVRGDFNALIELMNHFQCGLLHVKSEPEAYFLQETVCPSYAPFIPKTIQRLCDARIGAGYIVIPTGC